MYNNTGRATSGKVPIRFGTYNIQNGRKGGLEAALRGKSQDNMDLGILQENKLTDGVYTRGSAGYSVIVTDAPSRHRGSIALFYRSEPHFVVEAVEKFGPNVLGFQLATGEQRWYIGGCVHRARGHGDDGEGSGGNLEEATGHGAAGGGQF